MPVTRVIEGFADSLLWLKVHLVTWDNREIPVFVFWKLWEVCGRPMRVGGGAIAPLDIFIWISVVIMLTVLGMGMPNSVILPLFFPTGSLLYKHI